MASEDVHAAIRSIYHGALMYADATSNRRHALLCGDEKAATEAAVQGTDAWMKGIRDGVLVLFDRIEVLEGMNAPVGA